MATRANQPAPLQRLNAVRSRFIALDEVWTSFFTAAQRASEDAISKGWVARDDFAAYEPSLFVGVPSLVATEALLRSKDARGIILMDGTTEVTDNNRPRGFFPDRIFTPMMALRSTLADLNLSEEELALIKRHAVTCGASSDVGEAQQQQDPEVGGAELESDRRRDIMRVLASIQSIAIDVSRAPTFHRRFSEVMEAVGEEPAP